MKPHQIPRQIDTPEVGRCNFVDVDRACDKWLEKRGLKQRNFLGHLITADTRAAISERKTK